MPPPNSPSNQPSSTPPSAEVQKQIEAGRERREQGMLSLMRRIGVSSGLPGDQTGRELAELMKMGEQERAYIESTAKDRLADEAFRTPFLEDIAKVQDSAGNLKHDTYLKGFESQIKSFLKAISHETVEDSSKKMPGADFLLKSPSGHSLSHERAAIFRRDRLLPWKLEYNKTDLRYTAKDAQGNFDEMYRNTADLVAALDDLLTRYEKQVLDIRSPNVPTPSQILAAIEVRQNPPLPKGEYSTKSEMSYVARLLITFTAATGMIWNVVGSILSRGKIPGFTNLSFMYAAAAGIAAYWPHMTKQGGVKFQEEINAFKDVWGEQYEYLAKRYFAKDKEGWATVAGKLMEKDIDTDNNFKDIKQYQSVLARADSGVKPLTKDERDKATEKLGEARMALRKFLAEKTPSLDSDIGKMIEEKEGQDIDTFALITVDAKKTEQGQRNLLSYIHSGATKQSLSTLGQVAKQMAQ